MPTGLVVGTELHNLLRSEPLPHIKVCGLNERFQGRFVNLLTGPQLDVAHKLAVAFEQPVGIGKFGPAKKAHVDVGVKSIGIRECGVPNTSRRMAVVLQLSDIIAAGAHNFKPAARDCSQFVLMLAHPGFDFRISSNRTGKSHQLAHGGISRGAAG